MKKSNEQTLGEILKHIAKGRRVAPGYNEFKIKKWWENTMGEMINEQTNHIFLKGETLYIKVNSSALKSELNMNKNELIERLNEHLEDQIITKLQIN